MEVDVSHSELLRLWAFNTLSSLSLSDIDFNTRCYWVELTLKVLEEKKRGFFTSRLHLNYYYYYIDAIISSHVDPAL